MNKPDKCFALILAGGKGKRLWPISTKYIPKQYLPLYSKNIMVNETINRIKDLINYNNIFIITNIEQKDLAEKCIDKHIPRKNIIYEPMEKNTAMCIFYASIKILKEKGDGIIAILSSDHYINPINKFKDALSDGILLANRYESLVTVGIKPTYPSTGFGYIKYYYNKNLMCNEVESFKEKPVLEKAVQYYESNEYYWNSGIFIWKLSTIMNNYKKYLAEIYKYKEKIESNIENEEKIKKIYEKVPNMSIDKGILEKATNIKMVVGEFEWMDIGNINDFFKIQKNRKKDKILKRMTKNCDIYSDDRESLIVLIGTDNLNVIKNNNVILIANKEKMQELPEVEKEIDNNDGLKKYL